MSDQIAFDASVLMGLMTKTCEVFEREDAYLTFPLSPVVFDAAHLQFTQPGGLDAEGQRAFAEFSLLVNSLPDGLLWQPTDRKLWNVLEAVLGPDVVLAQSGRTPDEEAAYQAALDLLTDVTPEGLLVDSPVMATYRQCRDAVFVAEQAYNDVSGGKPSDEAALAAWQTELGHRQSLLGDAQQQWVTVGQKAVVEQAKNTVLTLGDKAPAITWARYRQLFDPSTPEITFAHDATLGRFMETGFAPSDVITGGGWQHVTLPQQALAELAARAPAALRDRLGAASGPSPVTEVSFDCTSVSVVRPWCERTLFESKGWKFRDTNRRLSDGANPPVGECVAYVVALVLARNITVVMPVTASPPAAPAPIGPLRAVFVRPLPPVALAQARLDAPDAGDAPLGRRVGAASLKPAAVALRAGGDDVAVREVPDTVVTKQQLVLEGRPNLARLRFNDFERLPSAPPDTPPPVTPPDPQATTVTTPSDQVFVLAFICQPMAKSPDPDPALPW